MGAALPIITTVATVYSIYQARKAEAKQEKRVQQQETRAAEQAKKIAEQTASDEEKRHRAILGTQEARYAASGVTMEGSPLLVQMESLRESEEQLRRIREGGEYESLAYTERAGAAGERAQEARRSGYIEMIGAGAGGTYQTGRQYDWW
jgi:hypothetical protein